MVSDTFARLLALDWGTSSLRAFLMQDGKIIETRQSDHGIQHLPSPGVRGFEQALQAIAGDWVQHQPTFAIVASGMVGSAQGWLEAPYVLCPADIRMLAHQRDAVSFYPEPIQNGFSSKTVDCCVFRPT